MYLGMKVIVCLKIIFLTTQLGQVQYLLYNLMLFYINLYLALHVHIMIISDFIKCR